MGLLSKYFTTRSKKKEQDVGSQEYVEFSHVEVNKDAPLELDEDELNDMLALQQPDCLGCRLVATAVLSALSAHAYKYLFKPYPDHLYRRPYMRLWYRLGHSICAVIYPYLAVCCFLKIGPAEPEQTKLGESKNKTEEEVEHAYKWMYRKPPAIFRDGTLHLQHPDLVLDDVFEDFNYSLVPDNVRMRTSKILTEYRRHWILSYKEALWRKQNFPDAIATQSRRRVETSLPSRNAVLPGT